MWFEAAQLLHEVRALHQRHVSEVKIAKYLVLEPVKQKELMIPLYLWINAPSNNIFRINNNELVIRITSWFPILFFFVNFLPDWFVPFYNFLFLKFVILPLLFRIFYNWWWNEDLIIVDIIFNVWYCGLISRLWISYFINLEKFFCCLFFLFYYARICLLLFNIIFWWEFFLYFVKYTNISRVILTLCYVIIIFIIIN